MKRAPTNQEGYIFATFAIAIAIAITVITINAKVDTRSLSRLQNIEQSLEAVRELTIRQRISCLNTLFPTPTPCTNAADGPIDAYDIDNNLFIRADGTTKIGTFLVRASCVRYDPAGQPTRKRIEIEVLPVDNANNPLKRPFGPVSQPYYTWMNLFDPFKGTQLTVRALETAPPADNTDCEFVQL